MGFRFKVEGLGFRDKEKAVVEGIVGFREGVRSAGSASSRGLGLDRSSVYGLQGLRTRFRVGLRVRGV